MRVGSVQMVPSGEAHAITLRMRAASNHNLCAAVEKGARVPPLALPVSVRSEQESVRFQQVVLPALNHSGEQTIQPFTHAVNTTAAVPGTEGGVLFGLHRARVMTRLKDLLTAPIMYHRTKQDGPVGC
jgi:hypothetical protein